MEKIIQYLIKLINNDQSYNKKQNFSIENYIDSNLDLIYNDLRGRMRLSCDISWIYTEEQPELEIHKNLLNNYAKFLIHMFDLVINNNISTESEMQYLHIQQYNWHRSNNYLNRGKKFNLL